MTMITVLLAGPADVPVLVTLMGEFYGESGYPLDPQWAAGALSDLIADPSKGAIWLISIDGRPAGHLVLSIRFAMEFGGLMGYVDDLFVRSPDRRRGAATAGLEVLVAECARRGCKALAVEVDPSNVAGQAAYRRFGMRPGADQRQHLTVVFPSGGSDLASDPDRG